ncbi:RDD family protein [Novosphingobium terrae]|uniref:RDD family protein n=1 Tax=Novosphingobium terrae TaxID=2726189 RepID=UPI00198173AC|nr:RDD family protein [Novosphingobium terrae]
MADPRRDDPRRRVLVTPEGLTVPFTLASRGSRFGALLIDLICMGLSLLLSAIAIGFTAGSLSEMGQHLRGGTAQDHAMQALFALWIITAFLIRNAWFIAFELGPRGATPGKRLMRIRIAARDGARLTPERVIARNLLRDIELFLPLIMLGSSIGQGDNTGWLATLWFLLFALLPLFNRDRLRAGDLIAGTWVVERPRKPLARAMTEQAAHAPAAAYRFRDTDLAAYGEYELQRLEEVLRLRKDDQMALVATAICDKIGWNTPHGADVGPFLDAYYTQLRERLEGGMRMGRRKADKHA